MNEAKWALIMATQVPVEPRSMPAVNSNGTDVVRQLRAALWIHGKVRLSLNEVREMVD